MNTEQILKLNQVEKGEYVKPKWWVKEGERRIDITAEANGNLILCAYLGDDKVLWFSQSKWDSEETTAAILQVIIDTQKEPNNVWHTTELKKILAPLSFSETRIYDGFRRETRIQPYHFFDWEGVGHSLTDDAATMLARQLTLILVENRKKANGTNVLATMHRLETLEQALRPLTEITESGQVYQAYMKAKKLYEELRTMEYAKLSDDGKLRGLYGICEGMYLNIYSHNMSVAR